jgi:putative PIN family toxin of toxin-antitoxin system
VTIARKLVLDTNIVLDWLVFDNAFMNALRDGVRDRHVVVITYQAAIDELQRVLDYPALKLTAEKQMAVLSEYRARSEFSSMPTGFRADELLLPPGFPRCRDRDDQHFLALAFHSKADALVSRDKAVLKLTKRARKFGVTILDVPQMIALLS